MSVESIDHVGLTVPDIEAAVAFYRDVVGCTVVSRPEPGSDQNVRRLVGVPDAKIRGAMLQTPAGQLIGLVMYEEPKKPAVLMETTTPSAVHLAFRVQDIDEVLERLKKTGSKPVSGPVQLGSGRFVYCRDPFGVLLELIEPSVVLNA
jgi:catechol 2,3-dioxygenase-like lactoylglutathione lyase family enzyme